MKFVYGLGLLALAGLVSGHVRMKYTGWPIRNAAGGNTADGKFSVSGACGGVNTWGVNGAVAVNKGDLVMFTHTHTRNTHTRAHTFSANRAWWGTGRGCVMCCCWRQRRVGIWADAGFRCALARAK